MGNIDLKPAGAIQWDSYNNKVYFDIGKGSLEGRLILRKAPSGKIDMQIFANASLPIRQGLG